MDSFSLWLLGRIQSVWASYILHQRTIRITSVSVVSLAFLSSALYFGHLYATQHLQKSAVTEATPTLSLPEGGQLVVGLQDSIVHTCKAGDTLHSLLRDYYKHSYIFLRDDFKSAFLELNPELKSSSSCKAQTVVTIPDPIVKAIENTPLSVHPESENRSMTVKAVYLRGENAVPGRLSKEVSRLKKAGANAIVFDVKDILGVVNYTTSIAQVEEYRKHKAPIPDIAKMIRFFHENDIYVIARASMFQDENLAIIRPDLAISDRNSPTGKLLVKGKPLWVDPGQPEVQLYNLKIIHELVQLGVDEIQLDYIRYPAEGDLSGVTFYKVNQPLDKTRHLTDFLAAAWILTRTTGVRLSIDVFGVVAWGEEADRNSTGQRLEAFAPFVDVVSPMLYPSHFNKGFDGFSQPADAPVHFYKSGNQRVRQMMGPNVVIRPWLQAFKWRVTNYNERYILQQIQGSDEGGGQGWMMWNAGNQYDLVYRALSGQTTVDLVENTDLKMQEKVN